MKSIYKLCRIGLVALLLLLAHPAHIQAQPGATVSFQEFYDQLQPYGTWIDDPDYGSVWIPDAEEGFKPYATDGHWVMTDYGNTWVSDFDWGWAPFHYGRWRFDDYYGWEWIPGSEWGPAWVNWRSGSDYYAWAPLGPGVSLDVAFGGNYYVPDDYWVCAPRAYINSPYVYNYYLPRNRVVNVYSNTTVINNVYVNYNHRFVSGPRFDEVRRYSRGADVRIFHINNVQRPGTTIIENNTVNIYRPNISRTNVYGERPRPATVVDARAYRDAHPNEGIAFHGTVGATINRDNSSRLARTARDPQPQNTNIVHVNRPAPNAPPGGNNNPGNNNNPGYNGGNRPARGNNQPNGTNTNPATTPNGNNGTPNNYGRPGEIRNQPNTSTVPMAVPNNNGNNNNSIPSTDRPNNNGRFDRNPNRPLQKTPTVTPPSQAAPAVQPSMPQQQQQQSDQQRQQRMDQFRQQQQRQQQQAQPQATPAPQPQQQQQRQQQPQVQPQQQQNDQQRQQRMDQFRQQQQQKQQQPQPQATPAPQQQRQQQPQAQPQQQQQQRQQPQAQPQQQQPRPQPQQPRPQRPQPQPRPQVVPVEKPKPAQAQ